MGKDAILKCKAASAIVPDGQTVMQRKGKPRVAARLAGFNTSWAKEPSHRHAPRRTGQVW